MWHILARCRGSGRRPSTIQLPWAKHNWPCVNDAWRGSAGTHWRAEGRRKIDNRANLEAKWCSRMQATLGAGWSSDTLSCRVHGSLHRFNSTKDKCLAEDAECRKTEKKKKTNAETKTTETKKQTPLILYRISNETQKSTSRWE